MSDNKSFEAILAQPRPTAPSTRLVNQWIDDEGHSLDIPIRVEEEVWKGWYPDDGQPVFYKQRDPLDANAWVWLLRTVKLSPSRKRISVNGETGSYVTPEASTWHGVGSIPESRAWFANPVANSRADNWKYFAFPWEAGVLAEATFLSDAEFKARGNVAVQQANAEREAELARGFTVRLAERLQNPRRRADDAAYAVLLDYPDGISAEDVKFLARLLDRALEDRETLDRQIRDAINAVSPDRHFNHSDRVQRALNEVLPQEDSENA